MVQVPDLPKLNRINPVPMTRRLTGNDDPNGAGTLVERLMLLAGRDLDALAFLKYEDVVLDLHRQFAFENIEELARASMRVADLAGRSRHEFFNHAEVRPLDQVPAVAIGAPFIMFGGLDADDRCRHV